MYNLGTWQSTWRCSNTWLQEAHDPPCPWSAVVANLPLAPKLAAALMHTVHHADIAFPDKLNRMLPKQETCLSTPAHHRQEVPQNPAQSIQGPEQHADNIMQRHTIDISNYTFHTIPCCTTPRTHSLTAKQSLALPGQLNKCLTYRNSSHAITPEQPHTPLPRLQQLLLPAVRAKG